MFVAYLSEYIITEVSLYVKLISCLGSFFVVTSANPIYSVLFLILVFLCISILFISLNVDFLALILIIVYLGAICVLFLFIIMMINIKVLELRREINYIPFSFLVLSFALSVFLFENDFLNNYSFAPINQTTDNEYFFTTLLKLKLAFFFEEQNFIPNSWSFDSLKTFGMVSYTFFSLQFLILGLVLLLAMVGAIFLTIETRVETLQQFSFSQISRNKNNFFIF